MTLVVTIENLRPPKRADSVAWTEALIGEADAASGSFTTIDTLTLSPVDADPLIPQLRTLTTNDGTDADLWYRVTWRDVDGNVSLPSLPIQNTEDTSQPYATVDELARILKLRSPSADQSAAMQRVLESAAGEIDSELGRDADDPLSGWELSLAAEVNIERAVEHWQQQQVPWGIIQTGGVETSTYIASDTWKRHANKLAPLKRSWGLA